MGDKKDEIKEILKEYKEELLSEMKDLFQAYLCRPISENKDDVSVEAEEKLKKQLDLQKDSNQELQEKLKTQEEQLKQQEEDLNSFKDKFDDLMKYWKMYQGPCFVSGIVYFGKQYICNMELSEKYYCRSSVSGGCCLSWTDI